MIFLKKLINSSLMQNIFALSFVQVLNYILPLLLIPYLLKTLGASGWGKIVFVQLVLQYFIVVVTYGFQWSAVNKISPVRKQVNLVNKLFSGYFFSQLLLLMLCLLILSAGVLIFDNLRSEFDLFYIGFIAVAGTVIFPIWLMQALEELKFVALTQLVSQIFCFSCIFLFVNSSDDLDVALFFQSINNLISGSLCFWFLYKKGYKLTKISISDIVISLKDGFTLFTSQVWISLYTNSIPIILGLVTNSTVVATYSVADRIQKAIRFILNPISRAIFPRISFLQKNDIEKSERLLKISIAFTFIITVITSLILFTFIDKVIQFLNAENLPNIYSVIYIFAVMPVLVGLSSVISIQALIPKGYSKALNRIWFSACLITLLIIYPIVNEYGVVGAAILAILVEAYILILMLTVLMRGRK